MKSTDAQFRSLFGIALAVLAGVSVPTQDALATPVRNANSSHAKSAVVLAEFVNPNPPYHTSHASTIAQTRSGTLVAAWFCGSAEGHADVSVCFARKIGDRWSRAAEVANGIQTVGKRYEAWNPVLFQDPQGALFLFYKVGPADDWWGMVIQSADGGRTWGKPQRLPDGILGPDKDKLLVLPDGTWLAGSSGQSDKSWRVHFELSRDRGKTWTLVGPVDRGAGFDAIQPTILILPHGLIEALCRTKQGVIAMTWSRDGGRTWTPLAATELPNPNSGIDAVTLADGRLLLVYNHSAHLPNWSGHGNRYPLDVAISRDGIKWKHVLTIEDAPSSNAPIQLSPPTRDEQLDVFGDKGFSYPAVIQTSDGLVHITYTWNRRMIKHVVVDPRKLAAQ
jgi:predicted neuraminidase